MQAFWSGFEKRAEAKVYKFPVREGMRRSIGKPGWGHVAGAGLLGFGLGAMALNADRKKAAQQKAFSYDFDKKAEANWKHIGGGIAAGLGLGGIAGHMIGKRKGLRQGSAESFNLGAQAGLELLNQHGAIDWDKLKNNEAPK